MSLANSGLSFYLPQVDAGAVEVPEICSGEERPVVIAVVPGVPVSSSPSFQADELRMPSTNSGLLN